MQINLDKKNLKFIFFFCLILTLVGPSLMPSIRLMFFVPFLIVSMYQRRLTTCLWYALFCGLILDLLSSSPRLGVQSLGLTLTTLLIYPQRKNFYADSLSTLPIMTFAYSMVFTAILGFVLYTVDIQNVFSMHWAFTDLVVMPAADALFAFAVFVIPSILFGKRIRRGNEYFLK